MQCRQTASMQDTRGLSLRPSLTAERQPATRYKVTSICISRQYLGTVRPNMRTQPTANPASKHNRSDANKRMHPLTNKNCRNVRSSCASQHVNGTVKAARNANEAKKGKKEKTTKKVYFKIVYRRGQHGDVHACRGTRPRAIFDTVG